MPPTDSTSWGLPDTVCVLGLRLRSARISKTAARTRPRSCATLCQDLRGALSADTSVIGGCVDAEFEKASQLLMETFRRSEATLVISSLTLLELASAPAAVQAALSRVPEADREYVELTEDAVVLADLYIDAGAIGAKNRADAQHIAVATVSRVGVLVSWNFRHIVNLRKIQAYNSVNLREGYPTLEIRTPREVIDHGQD